MQKLCPKCFNMFPTTAETCPEDGASLVLPVDQDLTGKVVNEKYEVLERIGEGGMGYVYRARHLRLQREVALKVLRAEIVKDRTVVQRFLNEARASASLTSPHTITLHDFGVSKEGFLFYEMELLSGRSVAQLIKQEAPLAPGVAARIVLQACESLEEAHKKGILHRDIKPDNLFVARSGNKEMVKVLDFGIAKMLGESKFESELTSAGTIIGTPQYLSPEQACGDEVGPASDLYSLAIVLYELVTGRPPFKEKTPILTMAAHIRSPMPPLSSWEIDIPRAEALQAFLIRALDKVASCRFASAEDFRTALLEATGEAESLLVTPAGSAASGGEPTQQWDTSSVKVVLEDSPPTPGTTVRETVDPHGATEFHETTEEERKAVEQARAATDTRSPEPPGFDFDEPTLDSFPSGHGPGRRLTLVAFAVVLVLITIGLIAVFRPAPSDADKAQSLGRDASSSPQIDASLVAGGLPREDVSRPVVDVQTGDIRQSQLGQDAALEPLDATVLVLDHVAASPDLTVLGVADAHPELTGQREDVTSGPIGVDQRTARATEEARRRDERRAKRLAREAARKDAEVKEAARRAAAAKEEAAREAAREAKLLAAAKVQAAEANRLVEAARKAKASGNYDSCITTAAKALKLDAKLTAAATLVQECQKRQQEEQNALDGIKIDDSSVLDGLKTK